MAASTYLVAWRLLSLRGKNSLSSVLDAIAILLTRELEPDAIRPRYHLWCFWQCRPNPGDCSPSISVNFTPDRRRAVAPIGSELDIAAGKRTATRQRLASTTPRFGA